MYKYILYSFCKYAKYIGILGVFLTLYSDSIIYKWLSLFGLLVIIEIFLCFPTLKCSLLQIIGIVKVNRKYGKNIPSIDKYESNIQYDLPFEGEWAVVNGCFTKEFSHSWGIPTQRYAYDFIILDENGKSYVEDFKKDENYYCYEKAILSPADGVVEKIVNDSEDSLILGSGKFFSRARHIAGNYILIKHRDNEYSTLAHLKKDSIAVKEGEKVLRGQKIATCGNSGNSTEPHLHFHLQDSVSLYKSAGLPVRFSDIKLSIPLNYYSMDSRPHMSLKGIPKGLITRGYNVSNNKF